MMQHPVLRPSVVGFHIPSWISPFVSLSRVMADFLRFKDEGPRGWTRFANNHEARPGQTVVAETDESRLAELVVPELLPQTVPATAQALTLSADMQKDHFYYSICAHGLEPRQEWIIDYGTLGSFEELGALIYGTTYQKEGSDEWLAIWRSTLDTGGGEGYPGEETRTRQAYEWLLRQRPGVVFGTKGMSRKTPGIQVKFSKLQHFPDGRVMRMGLKLYQLDTEAFKDEIFWRISEESTEPIWFHAQAGESYFRQILSEKKIIKNGKEVWKQVRRDNHWLDCLVGHMAMAHWQWAPSLGTLMERERASAGQSGEKPKQKEKPARRSRW
jgi:phage terminase large subunit GpA-like protein